MSVSALILPTTLALLALQPSPQPGRAASLSTSPAVAAPAAPSLRTRPAPLMPDRFRLYSFGVSETSRFDANGIPQIKPWSNPDTWHYSPTVTAQWGLAAYVRADDATAIKAADWLVQHQDTNGGFPFFFNHAAPGAWKLKAPWYSAISQGNAISLLVRVWIITGKSLYLDSAKNALLLLQTPVSHGGLQGTMRELPWFELTPDPNWPNHILNGHIFALLGIHDLAIIGGDANAAALWRIGESSLWTNLRYVYPNGWLLTRPFPLGVPNNIPDPWMVYDLPVNGSNGTSNVPHYVTSYYMRVHLALLQEMTHRTKGLHRQDYTTLVNQLEASLKTWLSGGGS
jgi:hypothetical protein